MPRLGVVLSMSTAPPPKSFIDLGRLAEDQGFDAALVNEGLAGAGMPALAVSPVNEERLAATEKARRVLAP